MDAVSEARLQNVMPMLADKIRQMASMLETEGIEIRVVQGLRTVAEQDALYAQGRTTPGKIVTNCKGGFSYHNYGLAVDVVPSQFAPDQPYNPDWNSSHPAWKRMEAVGQSLGLDSGATWRTFVDAPHLQITGRFPEGAPNDQARTLAESGLPAVWEAVTSSLT
jgi:peptidoglycan LD-endopeptidase CwlK